MGLAQHQKIAGLGDVLRGGAPMHPAAMRLADDAAELPDQRHERVAGAGEAFVDARPVHQLQPGLGGDGLGRVGRDDAELGLGARQGGLDIEPRLPAVLQSIEGADAGIRHAGRGRESVAGGGHAGRLHSCCAMRAVNSLVLKAIKVVQVKMNLG